ncbi:MAG: methylenetetrahydrofolate reductase [Candidatus Omnitrophica bacterium]|nr:methylenetetrahydrofolate reductase [Candidatus Omnitrophota bacterium]
MADAITTASDVARFESRLGKKSFLVTMEVNPPKGTDLSEILAAVKRVAGLVDAINVTDGSGAIMRACSLAVAKIVLDAGLDPILQMTCRDRNRLALQADLLGASILGIRNVLLLTGDDPKAGDHPDAKPVFDINSAALMQVAKGLTQGKDMAGKELSGAPQLCIGAAADPGAKDLEVEMQKFKAKIDAGVSFFQTQAVFDAQRLRAFMERAKMFSKPVLAGILLVKSAKMARYMNEHVWGIHVPEDMIARFERASDKRAECVAVTAELIQAVRDVANGIHLYALGWEELVPAILKKAGVA